MGTPIFCDNTINFVSIWHHVKKNEKLSHNKGTTKISALWHTPLLHFTFETLSHYLPKIFSGSQFWFHLATSMPAVFLISKVATSLLEIFVCCYCISGAIITWSSSHRPYKNKEMEKKTKQRKKCKEKTKTKKGRKKTIIGRWALIVLGATDGGKQRRTPMLCGQLGTRLTYFPFGNLICGKKILGKYY